MVGFTRDIFHSMASFGTRRKKETGHTKRRKTADGEKTEKKETEGGKYIKGEHEASGEGTEMGGGRNCSRSQK